MTKILDPEETLFISDTHFQHARILDLSNRPFKDVEEHDEVQIKRWNSVVSPTDTVIHCGDVALGPWPVGLQKVSRLNGRKILLPGNHDRISSLEKQTRRDRFMPDYEAVFDEIWDETVEVWMDNYLFMVSHYPPAQIKDHGSEDRYPHLRPVDDGNHHFIHGHTHQSNPFTELDSGMVAVHVGVDSQNYYPLRGTTILNVMGFLTTQAASARL